MISCAQFSILSFKSCHSLLKSKHAGVGIQCVLQEPFHLFFTGLLRHLILQCHTRCAERHCRCTGKKHEAILPYMFLHKHRCRRQTVAKWSCYIVASALSRAPASGCTCSYNVFTSHGRHMFSLCCTSW